MYWLRSSARSIRDIRSHDSFSLETPEGLLAGRWAWPASQARLGPVAAHYFVYLRARAEQL